MQATLKAPTGFSEPAHYEQQVDILGYSYGKHRDGNGYNNVAECMMAIVAMPGGKLNAVPIHWLELQQATPL